MGTIAETKATAMAATEKTESAWREAWMAVRRNLVPMLVLWGLAVLFLVVYYLVPGGGGAVWSAGTVAAARRKARGVPEPSAVHRHPARHLSGVGQVDSSAASNVDGGGLHLVGRCLGNL